MPAPRAAGCEVGDSARIGQRGPRGPQGPPGSIGSAGADGIATALAPEAWKPLEFSGGWANYGAEFGAASFRKDKQGQGHVRGLVTQTPASLNVEPDGSIVWLAGSTTERSYTSLNTIAFYTD